MTDPLSRLKPTLVAIVLLCAARNPAEAVSR
jgi:hypothetical protein